MLRTHTCAQISLKKVGKDVRLCGWVNKRRDLGGFVFVDLRDRYGISQIIFDKETSPPDVWQTVQKIRAEFVLSVHGKVTKRSKENVNKSISTGEVEVVAVGLEILSESKTPPFELDKDFDVNEEVRYKYRYLDMRREKVKNIIEFRHKFVSYIREYLTKKDFWEIETPLLTKSTPEGARDYVVPARNFPGMFYALPQSPQQYKQLLMVGGMDKYFQIARCLRDEDQRGDRQAEFTQLDLEMSFVEQDDILRLIEDMFSKAVEKFSDKEIMFKPWPRIAYKDALLKYGSDKPDLRFGLEIKDVSAMVKGCEFKVFADTVVRGGVVRGICAVGAGNFSRKKIDELESLAKQYGVKGLAYIKVGKDEFSGGIVKFLGQEKCRELAEKFKVKENDIIFFGAGSRFEVEESLCHLRLELGKCLNLIPENKLGFAYIVDFPLFEEGREKGKPYAPGHHMFTMPKPEDIHLLDTDPHLVRSLQHDLVCNGYEVGGGSIRIADAGLQKKIFGLIGFSQDQKEEFAHMLEAFAYGVPPHGGIAPGLDRLIMCILGEPNIREVMAFPKTGDGRDLTMGAPGKISSEQLKELHIKLDLD